jgi:hypothetical protein
MLQETYRDTAGLIVLRDELQRLEAKVTDTLAKTGTNPKAPTPHTVASGIEETDTALRTRPARSVFETMRNTSVLMLLTAPLTFSLIVPIVLLDMSVSLYQLGCFQVWKLEPVQRRDYVILDRHRLAYLNAFEKLACLYCGYFNGVIAFTREVASRTEAYWCPIKHVARPAAPHERYDEFLGYGDAAAWQERLDALKRKIN